jgi:putative acetyltransferase
MTPARILPARVPEDLEAVRALCREYADSLPYSLCFQGLEEELAGLPGKYAPPAGRLLIAQAAGPEGARPEIAGCVALRPLDPSEIFDEDPWPACEMKRLYVRPALRGDGLGRLLCERLIDEARFAGYLLMKLDSDTACMTPAIRLYRSLGFNDIRPYNNDPMAGTVWMGLRL